MSNVLLAQEIVGEIISKQDWEDERGDVDFQGISQNSLDNAGGKMYAVVFDFDTAKLKKNYHVNSYNNAYKDIGDFLKDKGFTWTQGSVYFGNSKIDAVTCVVTVQKIARQFDWFAKSIRDIRMLRIEETNDLLPAVKLAVQK